MVETYGQHSENAARALNALIREDVIPAGQANIDRLLHCREAVVDALRQRLYDIGHDNCYPPPDHPPARLPKRTLAGWAEHLATLIHNIAFALPSLPWDERRPPTDVLTPRSPDTTVEAWREAAVELLAASHALSAAAEQPWRTDSGAAWWVIRDTAVALEAVLVLDGRLDEVGLLHGHHRPEYAMGVDDKRMVLSQTARVATWHATTASPDDATPTIGRTTHIGGLQPVSLVSGPLDLATAQQRLARFLRPLIASEAALFNEPQISSDCARQVTASQLYLCRTFARAAEQSQTTSVFVRPFTERAEILESLQPQIRYLVDVKNPGPSMHSFWQQSELTTAVARMDDQGVRIQLQPSQMAELVSATSNVTRNLGKAMRRELLGASPNLLDGHPRHEGPVRVGRRSRLEATLTDLVNLPVPNEPEARYSNPLQRAALKATLDLTPSTSAAPTPFPAARVATYTLSTF